jgi:hypothetical protein
MTINSHNPNNNHPVGHDSDRSNAEDTLRLIADLPAPQGLEERVHQKLTAARAHGTAAQAGPLLAWPVPRSSTGREWMRAAAAAAIAFVIAGGGWGIYRQVQPLQAGTGIRLAPHGAAAGGFAGAGAMRTPETLNGPVLTHPVVHSAEAPATPTLDDQNSGEIGTAPGSKAEAKKNGMKSQPPAKQKKRSGEAQPVEP